MGEEKQEGKLNIINRDEYPMFKPSPVETYKSKTRIKSVRFQRISPDRRYEELKEKNQNIDITSSEIYVNGRKPIDGIFSPLFGADTTQDTPIFTCDCHQLTGGSNRGRICPNCGTEVRTIEADLRIQGTIDIAPYHIMTFHGWTAMSKAVKNLPDVIKSVRKISASGKIIGEDKPTIMDLYDNYDDVYFPMTGLPKEYAWMTKIPVYSSRLRPLMEEHKTMGILDINKHYLSIVNLAGILRTSHLISGFHRELEIQRTLNQVQDDWNEICKIISEQINGKTGTFRKSLAAGRLDNSSRLVISAGDDLKAHEVDIPYQTMMVQYEEEIAKYLSIIQNIPLSQAISMVDEYQVVTEDPSGARDPKTDMFIKIINQYLRSRKGVWILVNRNPTISESGVQYMRIRKIHEDTTDMTLHLPPDVLPLLAADYDGDGGCV